MAFTLFVHDWSCSVDVPGVWQVNLFEWAQAARLPVPICDHLLAHLYESPSLDSVERVLPFRRELSLISAECLRHAKLRLEPDSSLDPASRKPHMQALYRRALSSALAADPVHCSCTELEALCKRAVQLGVGLESSSD